MTERPTVSLDDPVALRAYAHPLRMSLVGLLRREGPLTATQAAARLDESVPNCSFHLRQLAKYGLVERAEGADAREKPWQATALSTVWGRESDDEPTRAAVDHLDAMLIRRLHDRAMQWLARRDADGPQWRAVTGPGDDLAWLTPDELAVLSRRIDELFDEYRPRMTDPSLRPPDARAVAISYYVTTYQP